MNKIKLFQKKFKNKFKVCHKAFLKICNQALKPDRSLLLKF